MSVLLTDEEMEEISGLFRYDKGSYRNIAIAQAKKLVGWLDEECREHWHGYPYHTTRVHCPKCVDALRREVGE